MAYNPYRDQPAKAFWKGAVAERHFADMSDLCGAIDIRPQDRIATGGSCFAQHIGRALKGRGANYLDLEPAPAFLSPDEAKGHGFGVYSCRYGNLYTVRQLLQLAREAFDGFQPAEIAWERDGRWFDALRLAVDPVGHDSAATVLALRGIHLRHVRAMFETLDVFVFTLGLTEGWTSLDGGTIFAGCPGTIAGDFDPARYRFHNTSYIEIRDDFLHFHAILKSVNPGARVLLTVSPVSLAATASQNHVLVANTYSKATLRAVAGDLASTIPGIFYFPSFEIITTHVNHGSFYDPDLRNVNPFGVAHVMEHFFALMPFGSPTAIEDNAVICDEERLTQA